MFSSHSYILLTFVLLPLGSLLFFTHNFDVVRLLITYYKIKILVIWVLRDLNGLMKHNMKKMQHK